MMKFMVEYKSEGKRYPDRLVVKDKEDSSFAKRYEILVSREEKSDALFFYAVKTTGIFCKPGCSSRLPREENVLFFDSSEEAMQEGFRPCKRCHPLSDSDNGLSGLIVSICRTIEQAEEEPTLKELSDKTGYSETYLQKVFRRTTGITPREYASALKARRFRKGLESGESVTSSLYNAGYGSSSRVYENLNDITAMTPTQYADHGKGTSLRSGVFPCSLGLALIALTDKGVAAVDLGDSEESLQSSFRQRFSKASISGLSKEDQELVRSVVQQIENPAMHNDIPLDIHGTVFQKKVWLALRNIPSGETRTYSDIAREIGNPSSVRAVARACAGNRIAVLIPCHRVVRKNGDVSGYRWGNEKKIKLLEWEKGIG